MGGQCPGAPELKGAPEKETRKANEEKKRKEKKRKEKKRKEKKRKEKKEEEKKKGTKLFKYSDGAPTRYKSSIYPRPMSLSR